MLSPSYGHCRLSCLCSVESLLVFCDLADLPHLTPKNEAQRWESMAVCCCHSVRQPYSNWLPFTVRHEQIRRLILPFCSPKTSGRAWLVQEHRVCGELAISSMTWESCGRSKRKRDICHGRKTNGLPLGRVQDGFIPPHLCSHTVEILSPLMTAGKADLQNPL